MAAPSPPLATVPASLSSTVRKSATIKLGNFDGSNVPLETHLAKLTNCSNYYSWSPEDRVCHLKASLEGPAATLLWQLPATCSEDTLVALLRSRFGTHELIERYRCELRQRRRYPGESLQSLYNDVCRLLSLSYPGETGSLSRLVGRDAFLDSLNNPDLRIKVLERGAQSIDTAYTIVAQYEAYVAAAVASDSTPTSRSSGQYDVRAVGACSPVDDRLSTLEKAVSNLTASIQRMTSPPSMPILPSVNQTAPFQPPQPSAVSQTSRVCWFCHQAGHLRSGCPVRPRPPQRTAAAAYPTTSTNGSVNGIRTPVSDSEALLPIRLQRKGGLCSNILAVMDSGASHCILPAKFADEVKPTNVTLKVANGDLLPISGASNIAVHIGSSVFNVDFIVSELIDEVLLSYSFLRDIGAIWDFGEHSIIINNQRIALQARNSDAYIRRVAVAESVKIQPNCCAQIPVMLKYTNLSAPCCNSFIIEPSSLNNSLVMPRMLIGGDKNSFVRVINVSDRPVRLGKGCFLGIASGCKMHRQYTNMLDDPDNCSNVLCIGDLSLFHDNRKQPVNHFESAAPRAEPESQSVADGVCALGEGVDVSQVTSATVVPITPVISDDVSQPIDTSTATLVDSILGSLPQEVNHSQRDRLRRLLSSNIKLFAKDNYDCGKTSLLECELNLIDPNSTPINEPLRRHALCHLDIIDTEIEKLLSADIIAPTSDSAFCSNLVLVKKRTAIGESPRYRVACDLSRVNNLLQSRQANLPHIDTVIQSLYETRYFTQLDFCQAFFAIPLEEESQRFTTFITRNGTYKFKRMPNGVKVAPATYCQLISKLFGKMLWNEILCFMDDLILPSKTIDEGIELLERVFQKLTIANLRLKPSKTRLLQTRAKILGLIVENGTISEDPSRIEVVEQMQFPRTVRQVRRFLGFVGWGRPFYPHLAEIIAPLNACLKKGARVVKNEETMHAFQRAKELMCKPPILSIFNPAYEHIVECDSSLISVGACLKQRSPDGVINVVAYHSQALTAAQRHYCITKLELFSILVALTKWRHMLLHKTVIVQTDHKSLASILQCRNLSSQLVRYKEYLSDFDLKIEYRSQSYQVVSDFLSRLRPCDYADRQCRQCRAKVVDQASRQDDADEFIDDGLTVPPLTDIPPPAGLPSNTEEGGNEGDNGYCCIMTRADYRKQDVRPTSSTSQTAAVSVSVPSEPDLRSQNNHPTDNNTAAATHVTQPADDNDQLQTVVTNRGRKRRRNILQIATPRIYKDILNWSDEYIIQEQLTDPTLSLIRDWCLSKSRPEIIPADYELKDYYFQFDVLELVDGILYRKYFNTHGDIDHFQVLIPHSMRAAFLELVHSSIGHAQLLSKNEAAVARYGYFPKWRRAIKIYIAACRRCQEYARTKPGRQGFLHPTSPAIGGPGEFLSIDLVGKLPMSNSYTYILTAQDCFSRYLYLIPLRDKTAVHVTEALMRIFLSHGFYSVVKSDLGSEFVNSVQSELDKVIQAVRITTTAYSPRNNPVERCHREIHAIIGKLIECHKTWSEILDYVQFVYNTTTHVATGFTPALLHLGREIQTSINLLLPSPPSTVLDTYGEYAQKVITRMELANKVARDSLCHAAEMAERSYNKFVKPCSFECGERVLIYSPRKYPGKFPKWQRHYSTEGTIIRKLSDVSYLIYDLKAKHNKIIHVDKIKRLIDRNNN